MSNGYLFAIYRLTSLNDPFKLSQSKSSRLAVEFEPRQVSTKFWLKTRAFERFCLGSNPVALSPVDALRWQEENRVSGLTPEHLPTSKPAESNLGAKKKARHAAAAYVIGPDATTTVKKNRPPRLGAKEAHRATGIS